MRLTPLSFLIWEAKLNPNFEVYKREKVFILTNINIRFPNFMKRSTINSKYKSGFKIKNNILSNKGYDFKDSLIKVKF